MNKFTDWLLGRHEHMHIDCLSLYVADLDDAIEELTKAIKDIREDVDYLIEFLGPDA
jgi:hypothetical protein